MRYLITGGSGYIGTRLVDRLSRREDTEQIVICDVAPPAGVTSRRPSSSSSTCATGTACARVMERGAPDVLVHLAFILNPTHDEHFMYDVDVNGTHNVLEAAAAAGVGQVLVTTSAVAYGAFADNPCRSPRTTRPRRGRFSYARDKTESDRICQLWAARAPRPAHDDRAALHRLRPERGQLPGAPLDQDALHRRRRHASTSRSSSCTRTTWWRPSPACCSAATAAPTTWPATGS